MSENIPVISQREIDLSKVEGALPLKHKASSELITEVVEADKIRSEVMNICDSLRPGAIDPTGKLGVDEIEIALTVSGKAGVRLIGEASLGAQASIKVKLKRK